MYRLFVVFTFFFILFAFNNELSLSDAFHYENEVQLFENFMKTYDKNYETKKEFDIRFANFKANLKRSAVKNADPKDNAIYGVTKFYDLTLEEFRARVGDVGLEGERSTIIEHAENSNWHNKFRKHSSPPIPSSVDWRDKNVVTPVKDQKDCGSYAFAAIAVLESQYAFRNQLTQLSEQQIFDCDPLEHRCSGEPYLAIKYLMIGSESEEIYPLTYDQQPCQFNASFVVAMPYNYGYIGGTEYSLMQFVSQEGPVTAFINVDLFQNYVSGIIVPSIKSSCDPKNATAYVTIVGYNLTDPQPFWILKNSWGTDWGENGYARLALGQNACGILNSNLIAYCH